MKISQLPECTRPVLFENDFDGFQYSMRGTCFLIKYANKTYAITAKHVIKGYAPSDVLIPLEFGSRDFVRAVSIIRPESPIDDDTDHKDFVVFELDDKSIPNNYYTDGRIFCMNLNQENYKLISSKAVVYGFPSQITFVDYEAQHLQQQRLQLSAQMLGRSDYVGVYKIAFDNYDSVGISSLDGISGSPVFVIADAPENRYVVNLEGMMIRKNFYLDFTVIALVLQGDLKTSQQLF